MHVRVDEPGQDRHAAGVDDLDAVRHRQLVPAADGDDAVVLHEHDRARQRRPLVPVDQQSADDGEVDLRRLGVALAVEGLRARQGGGDGGQHRREGESEARAETGRDHDVALSVFLSSACLRRYHRTGRGGPRPRTRRRRQDRGRRRRRRTGRGGPRSRTRRRREVAGAGREAGGGPGHPWRAAQEQVYKPRASAPASHRPRGGPRSRTRRHREVAGADREAGGGPGHPWRAAQEQVYNSPWRKSALHSSGDASRLTALFVGSLIYML